MTIKNGNGTVSASRQNMTVPLAANTNTPLVSRPAATAQADIDAAIRRVLGAILDKYRVPPVTVVGVLRKYGMDLRGLAAIITLYGGDAAKCPTVAMQSAATSTKAPPKNTATVQPPTSATATSPLGTSQMPASMSSATPEPATSTFRSVSTTIELPGAKNDADDVFLTDLMLALRWHTSVQKLATDRVNGSGPKFHVLGGSVVIRLGTIRSFEDARECGNTGEYRASQRAKTIVEKVPPHVTGNLTAPPAKSNGSVNGAHLVQPSTAMSTPAAGTNGGAHV